MASSFVMLMTARSHCGTSPKLRRRPCRRSSLNFRAVCKTSKHECQQARHVVFCCGLVRGTILTEFTSSRNLRQRRSSAECWHEQRDQSSDLATLVLSEPSYDSVPVFCKVAYVVCLSLSWQVPFVEERAYQSRNTIKHKSSTNHGTN